MNIPTPATVVAALVRKAEGIACGEDFCHVCGRATEHFGEHSPEQILRWANSPRGRWLMQ